MDFSPIKYTLMPDAPVTDGVSIDPAASFTYLTPDALMSFCEAQLQKVDTQFYAACAQQQSSNADTAQLASLSGDASLSAPDHTLDLNNQADFTYAWTAYEHMVGTLGKIQNPALKAALQNQADQLGTQLTTAYDNMVGNGCTAAVPFQSVGDVSSFFSTKSNSANVSIDANAWNSMVTQGLKGLSDSQSNDAEMAMINLQQLMSQRQSVIQICTNLVQSMGDQVNKVADNVGK